MKYDFKKGDLLHITPINEIYEPDGFGTAERVNTESVTVNFKINDGIGYRTETYSISDCQMHLATRLEKTKYALRILNGQGGLVKRGRSEILSDTKRKNTYRSNK